MSNTPDRPPWAFVELKRAIRGEARTVEEIAKSSGVDRNTIHRWLNGLTANPNIAEVDKVARALRLKLRLIK
jgi:DNA-binding phage protein